MESFRYHKINLLIRNLNHSKNDLNCGFTLIELLVVIAIMTVVMAIVFTSQTSFNKTLILTNTAYDVALSIRSTEAYGINGRVTKSRFNVGYGIHFDVNNPSVITSFADEYPTLFSTSGFCHLVKDTPADRPGDCVYQKSEKIKDYKLGNGMIVSDFCVKSSIGTSSTWTCSKSGSIASLDIVFSRPDSSAFISAGGVYSKYYTSACITISSPQGGSRLIEVTHSGAISANVKVCN